MKRHGAESRLAIEIAPGGRTATKSAQGGLGRDGPDALVGADQRRAATEADAHPCAPTERAAARVLGEAGRAGVLTGDGQIQYATCALLRWCFPGSMGCGKWGGVWSRHACGGR